MNIYLAVIVGLCVWTNSSVAAVVSPTRFLALMQQSQQSPDASQPPSPQQPAKDTQPPSPAQEAPPSQETAPEKAGSEKPKSEKPGSEKPSPEQSPPAQAAPAPTPTQEPQKTPPAASPKKPESAAKAPAKKRRRKHTAAASDTSTEKKVVRNGGTADPVVQLAPGVSDDQASRQRQSTTQLLATTDTNLKQLGTRQLSGTQQDSVSQIRKYMEQAKAAEAAGDVQRAQNLASKALMLSDDLVKH
jgi:hypothetical protein